MNTFASFVSFDGTLAVLYLLNRKVTVPGAGCRYRVHVPNTRLHTHRISNLNDVCGYILATWT